LVDLEPVKGRRLVCGFIGPPAEAALARRCFSEVSLCGYSGGRWHPPRRPGRQVGAPPDQHP
jgi:hypothetical protein